VPKATTTTKTKAKAGPAKSDDGNVDALKRERAGVYRTTDGRFAVEQSSSGWMLFDAEQTNELGLPLARGPFGTLDDARDAIPEARSGPAPASGIEPRQARRKPPVIGPAATPKGAITRGARRAPRRADPAALVIREIRVADGDELRKLWRDVGFRSLGDDDRSLARLARRNPGLGLVAVESGRIIGSALGAWDGRRGWIYHVATAESHRRSGVARRLVEQVEGALRDLGAPKVNVVVRADSDGGRELWKELGYEPAESRLYGKELVGA
jgi:ribosomal protein S18 acetylase RimI-like enzyme